MSHTSTHLQLPSAAASAARARAFVRACLQQWHHDELAEIAQLLTSELVTNAVLHARTTIELRVARTPDGVRVEVHDGNPEQPERSPRYPDTNTGRGIMLLDALAASWGVDTAATPNGKTVWFEVSA